MATRNLTTKITIQNLAEELKKKFSGVESQVNLSFKSLKVEGNTVNFYTTADKTGTIAATLDFPAEYFLDQTKTTMVSKFTWAEATYPGSTDPGLNDKPVLVLAVKGEGSNVSYSFLNMELLMNVYTAKVEGKDPSTTIDINGYVVDVKVNVSPDDGNILESRANGLYVPKPTPVDISGKTDKVSGATVDNLASLTADGNLADSGVAKSKVLTEDDISDFTAAEINAMLSGTTPSA